MSRDQSKQHAPSRGRRQVQAEKARLRRGRPSQGNRREEIPGQLSIEDLLHPVGGEQS